MKTIRFFHNNLFDAATCSSKSTPVSGYPLSNLLHDWYTKATRSSEDDDTWWMWNLGSAQHVDGIMFKGHNFRVGATVKIQANFDNDNTNWGYPNDEPDWEDVITVTADLLTKELIYNATVPASHCWWIRLSVLDDAGYGNPDGYLKLGKPWAGAYFEPSTNFTNAYMPKINDLSTVEMSADGYHFGTKVTPKLKSFEYKFENLTNADRLSFITMFEEVGITKTFFLLQDADSTLENLFYVRNMNATWEFTHIFMDNNFEFAMSVMESR